jgi:hypothetical protein
LTTKYGLAYATASQRPLFAVTADEKILSSPFFNIFVTLSLGLFSEDEARGLLAHRLQETPRAFSEQLADYLLELVGRHPFFLHIAGYHAYHSIEDGQFPEDPGQLKMLDAPIEIEADSHLSYLWHNLTGEEQYCLAITDGPIDVLRQLEQQCLVEWTAGGYRYTSEILHRFVRRQQVPDLIQSGPFVIDPQRHQVHAYGLELALTNSQFDLLMRLSEQPGQVVTAEDLAVAVWGDTFDNDPDRLKTLIKRLRRAIEPYGNWVVSERGIGYSLRAPG